MGLSRRAGASVWTLCGAIAASAAVAPSAIADGRVALSWRAVESCPSRAWVTGRVERYLDGALTQDASAQLQVEVEVEQDAAGWFTARARVRSAEGTRARTLGDADCLVVADAVAFIVARAIDPDVQPDAAPMTDDEVARGREGGGGDGGPASTGTGRGVDAGGRAGDGAGDAGGDGGDAGGGGSDDDGDTDGEADGDADEQDDADEGLAEPAEPSGPPLRFGWSLGFGATLAWQPLPALAPGAVAHAVLHVGDHVRVELAGGYEPPQTESLLGDPPAVPPAELRFERLHADLGLCLLAPSSETDLGLCLGGQLAAVRGSGVAFTDGRGETLPDLRLSAGPLLVHRLGRGFSLRFELAPTYAVLRPRFFARLGEAPLLPVYTADTIGFFARLGIEARID